MQITGADAGVAALAQPAAGRALAGRRCCLFFQQRELRQSAPVRQGSMKPLLTSRPAATLPIVSPVIGPESGTSLKFWQTDILAGRRRAERHGVV